MKNYFFILIILLFANTVFANDDMKFSRNFSDQLIKEKYSVANALQLTDEQMQQKEKILEESAIQLQKKMNELTQANLKLQTLKGSDASINEIQAQEKVISNLKNDILSIVDDENEKFKQILDRDQKAKLRMIQKLEKNSIKSYERQKKYRQNNPKMREFAPQFITQ